MKDSLFVKCMLVSGALHAIGMTIFLTCPVHFYPSFFTKLGKAPAVVDDEIVIFKKDAALEDAFKEFIVSPQDPVHRDSLKAASADIYVTAAADKPVALNNFLLLPESPEIATPLSLPTSPLDLTTEPLPDRFLRPPLTLAAPNPSIEKLPSNPFENLALQSYPEYHPLASESLVDFDYLPSQEKFQTPPTSVPAIPSPHAALDLDIPIVSKQEELPQQHDPLAEQPVKAPHLALQLPTSLAPYYPLPPISSYGILEFNTVEWNDTFDVDVKTLAREEGGYLFSLTFLPKADLSQHSLKQNYYFLIDRSNSIEKHRYQSFKRAVIRAISSLRDGDNFNILIFDAKIARLSETVIPSNKRNQRLAEEFLEKQPHGHYGTATTDIFTSLGRIIPPIVNDDEAHTAILISDGETSLKPDKQRNLINAWLEANRSKLTLYTAAVGQGNNLSTLDLLGTVSRGSMLYSDTHTGFPRKLAKLVLTLRSPIAKEMSLTTLSTDPSSRIQIFPSSSRLPYLFSDHPFVLYGTADKLSDFTIILEGRNKGQLLTIKKPISFASAKPGNRLLSKQWAAQQAHLFYDQYLKEGKPALLEEAKKLLSDELANPRR
ncbi:MAG: VWA domain-containing protein [Thermodesulfobacteriota bacterium]